MERAEGEQRDGVGPREAKSAASAIPSGKRPAATSGWSVRLTPTGFRVRDVHRGIHRPSTRADATRPTSKALECSATTGPAPATDLDSAWGPRHTPR